jgi:DmsE family decaheme c-type cytochrome
MRLRQVWFLALAAATLLWVGAVRGAPQGGEGGTMASADPEVCAGCHEDQVTALAHSPHSALDTKKLAAKAHADSSCAACHGDSAAHLEAGGGLGTMFGFGADKLASVKSEKCLTCHADTHPGFLASPHAAAGIDCTTCHSIHGADKNSPALLKLRVPAPTGMRELGENSKLCYSCHGDIFTQFNFNEHHRLQEGILECTSCHNPHAAAPRTELGGFKQEACIKCHADKGGPFVFEHGSVIVEGCVACHSPHGSPNRHLLNFQKTAELCYSCHNMPPSFHSRFTLETQCTNCHSSIHGSNFDAFFLK